MGQVCGTIQNQQKDMEEMKEAIKQLKEMMEQTKGAQEQLKAGLADVTRITAEITTKCQAISNTVGTFQTKVNGLEDTIKKTIQNAGGSAVSGAMKNFF